MLQNQALASETSRLLRRLCGCIALLTLLVALALLLPEPFRAELRRSGLAALPLAALVSLLGALLATLVVAEARLRVAEERAPPAIIGRSARLPQAALAAPAGLAALATAWWLPPRLAAPLAPTAVLGGGALALAFGLLIVERLLASVEPRRLPEAAGLRALAFVSVLAAFVAGLIEIAAGLGAPFTVPAMRAALTLAGLIGLELALRSLGRLFLPPPPPASAEAAVQSLLAASLASGGRGGVAAPIRRQLGIDFSRSWALLYVRRAALPMLLALGLMVWAISGLVVVDVDQRAVYERFGAPVAVLHSGLHAILPWPFGAARTVEFGQTHEVPLGAEPSAASAPVGAEDPAPASADRLWEQPHPGELVLLIATESSGRQGFQSVAADLRVLYRVGLSDRAAVQSAFSTVDPARLVRAEAGAAASAYFAARTLPDVLGANRDALAEALRRTVQAGLDRAGSGLQVLAMVVEAIHPPAGAADAYHAVRAAEISANASIFAEQGRALAVRAQSRQYADGQQANAEAARAELVGGADAALTRFTADRQAASVGGPSFLAERYFAALTTALARTPITVIDSRLAGPAGPVLDLRQLGAAAAAAATDTE